LSNGQYKKCSGRIFNTGETAVDIFFVQDLQINVCEKFINPYIPYIKAKAFHLIASSQKG